jgi:hypothetical protein
MQWIASDLSLLVQWQKVMLTPPSSDVKVRMHGTQVQYMLPWQGALTRSFIFNFMLHPVDFCAVPPSPTN